MKIVVISHHLPPTYRSGAELYAFRQARWLQVHGHAVSAVCVEDIEADLPSLEARTEIYEELEVTRLYFNRLNYENVLEASHYNPEIRDWLRLHLQQKAPDLLLVNACYLLGVGVLEAARELKIPTVVTLHDFWFLCQRVTLMKPDGSLCDGKVTPAECALCISKDQRRYLWLDKVTGGRAGAALVRGASTGQNLPVKMLGGARKLDTLALRRTRLIEALKKVDAIVAPSQYLKKLYVENGIPAEKIRYCRYGLDTEQLNRFKPGQETRPAKLRVGYLGQILPHKGVDVLVKAFKELKSPDISLQIYGKMGRDPAYDRKLTGLAAGDGRIEFSGAYSSDKLPEILENLEVVVVPSVWHENSPLVIMEAQAAGVPVITSNFGGMAEMVEHAQNGLLFELGSSEDLSRQLGRLVSEPDLLGKLRAGIGPVKSLDEEFAELLPLYESLLATRA